MVPPAWISWRRGHLRSGKSPPTVVVRTAAIAGVSSHCCHVGALSPSVSGPSESESPRHPTWEAESPGHAATAVIGAGPVSVATMLPIRFSIELLFHTGCLHAAVALLQAFICSWSPFLGFARRIPGSIARASVALSAWTGEVDALPSTSPVATHLNHVPSSLTLYRCAA